MSNDRREFEAWAISDGWDVTPADSANAELGATYQAIDTECVYVGWQAHAGSVVPTKDAETLEAIRGTLFAALEMKEPSLDKCDRSAFEMATIASNGIYWRNREIKNLREKLEKAESLSGAACDCGSHDLAPLYHHPSCPSAQPSLDKATENYLRGK